jgi:hypothetical protein
LNISTNYSMGLNPSVTRNSLNTGIEATSIESSGKSETDLIFEEIRETFVKNNLEDFDEEDDDEESTKVSSELQQDRYGNQLSNPVENGVPLPVDPFKNISRIKNAEKINNGELVNKSQENLISEDPEYLLPKNNSLIKLRLYAYEAQLMNDLDQPVTTFVG